MTAPADAAAGAFATSISEQLAGDDLPDVPTLLARAYAAAFAMLRDANGELDLAAAATALPGDIGRLDLDPAHLKVDDIADALWSDSELMLSWLPLAVEQVEWLAGVEGYESPYEIYGVHHGGRVFTFVTLPEADPYWLVCAHDESDPEGRDRMLRTLIGGWLGGAGNEEVSLSPAFDTGLRRVVRETSEANGFAPWDTGTLHDDLRGADDNELRRLAREHAPSLQAHEVELFATLRRLRSDPHPANDLERRLAWKVCWPDLELD